MDSSSSQELTTNKRQQKQERNSFGILSVNLLERGFSEGDQSDEKCDQEMNQSRRVNLKRHDEEDEGDRGEGEGEVEEEEEEEEEVEEREDIHEGTDQRGSTNIEEKNSREGDGSQEDGHAKDRIDRHINLDESNSFDSSVHDDYLSNQRQTGTETDQITLRPATTGPLSNTTVTPTSFRDANDSTRSSTSHLMQAQHNRQNHYQQQQQQHHHQHKHKSLHNNGGKEFDEVKQVELFGISIVALIINGKERLCLAQISNTLLKEFSYNEIHNRRVALGITCIQCTPIQLEMLRRAGAMPSSSRRCGMITMREAERLCRSFLVEEQPPELPENFYFTVAHRVNYGCKGRFVPARYISSRAKCIECFYCGEYYSPNKFIFHSHRQPHATDCNPPDSPNINSWRKHIDLDWTQEHGQDIKYAWEDVKSLFNGGTRRRAPNQQQTIQTTPSTGTNGANVGSSCGSMLNDHHRHHHHQRKNQKHIVDDDQLIVDVECDDSSNNIIKNTSVNDLGGSKLESNSNDGGKRQINEATIWPLNKSRFGLNQGNRPNQQNNSLILNKPASINSQISKPNQANGSTILATKRLNSSNHSQLNQANKRFAATNNMIQQQRQPARANEQDNQTHNRLILNEPNVRFQTQNHPTRSHSIVPPPIHGLQSQQQYTPCQSNLPFNPDTFLNQPNSTPPMSVTNIPSRHQQQQQQQQLQTSAIGEAQNGAAGKPALGLVYPMSSTSNFICSQLYSQLIQPQTQLQHQATNQQQHSAAIDAQIALRHHIWSSLLANLQCNASNQNC